MSEKLSRKERRAKMRNKPKVEETTWHSPEKKTFIHSLKNVYEKKYKLLLLIPFIMLISAFFIIGFQTYSTGDFVKKDISLKGGIQVTVSKDLANISALNLIDIQKKMKSAFPGYSINVREMTDFGKRSGIVFEASFEDKDHINQFISKISKLTGASEKKLNNLLSTMGSSLSKDFFKTAIISVIVAFLFMAFVVFLSFKTLAPSLAVVMAAFSDIVVTLSVVDLFKVELSTAGVAAFLMLIGYSVDTDILLSTRVLKRKENTIIHNIYDAMRTGLGMTLTTLGAVTIGLFFATSNELKQIFMIILIGLLVDVINTWIQNAGILRFYLERKEARK